jgi:hypothetical protein
MTRLGRGSWRLKRKFVPLRSVRCHAGGHSNSSGVLATLRQPKHHGGKLEVSREHRPVRGTDLGQTLPSDGHPARLRHSCRFTRQLRGLTAEDNANKPTDRGRSGWPRGPGSRVRRDSDVPRVLAGSMCRSGRVSTVRAGSLAFIVSRTKCSRTVPRLVRTIAIDGGKGCSWSLGSGPRVQRLSFGSPRATIACTKRPVSR